MNGKYLLFTALFAFDGGLCAARVPDLKRKKIHFPFYLFFVRSLFCESEIKQRRILFCYLTTGDEGERETWPVLTSGGMKHCLRLH